MNEIASQGAQKRIDFIGRWALAFFAVFVILLGWLGGRHEVGKFGLWFELGIACAAVVGLMVIGLTVLAHRRIKQMEEYKDDG